MSDIFQIFYCLPETQLHTEVKILTTNGLETAREIYDVKDRSFL
jgi:hypothetical protein